MSRAPGIPFAASKRSTLGLEWELALVDRRSGELSPRAPEILPALRHLNDDGDRVTKELLTNTVEIVTGVHERVADGIADLEATIAAVRDEAEPLGADLMCAGTHPFSQWFQQERHARQRALRDADRPHAVVGAPDDDLGRARARGDRRPAEGAADPERACSPTCRISRCSPRRARSGWARPPATRRTGR